MSAWNFLQVKSVEYKEYLLDLMPLEKDAMIERYGQRSIPQIFVNDQHIAGLTERRELDSSGDLDKVLNRLANRCIFSGDLL